MAGSRERQARGGLYRLLARLWLREIDATLLRSLGTGTMGKAFLEVGGLLPAEITGETVESLAIDYCQLFLGPARHLPPYQSVWQSGQFAGEAVRSVQEFADVARYNAALVVPGVMVDHLGVQLDLMGHVLQGSAGGDAEMEAADAYTEAFYSAHLTWPVPLFKAARERAKSDFYRSLVSLTGEFLQSEAAQ